jgi:hypothetical protein
MLTRSSQPVTPVEAADRATITGGSNGVEPPYVGSDRATFTVLPLAEAARLTGRHPDLLRRWCASGRIDGFRVGPTWALTTHEVERLARLPARRRRAPDAGASAHGPDSR